MLGTCAIDMFGYYVPCCTLMIKRNEVAKRKHKFMEIGHVHDMDILTAWQSPKWQQLRAWQVAGLLAHCNRCEINATGLVQMKQNTNGMLHHLASMLPTF